MKTIGHRLSWGFTTLLFIVSCAPLAANDGYSLEKIADFDRPWSLGFLPDGAMLVTERSGALFLIHLGEKVEVIGLPDIAVLGQGGLLDVLPSQDFFRDSLVYFSFSESAETGARTSVGRGRLDRRVTPPRLSDVEIIFRTSPARNGGYHFGSRLAFGADGMLYVTLGERGTPSLAQDASAHPGSVLRLRPDGSIPSDNPDFGSGAAEGLFSIGHRNPQGMALHPETGDIWIHEHGPRGGDEINILKEGANYGWPLLTHGVNYDGSVISNRNSAPEYQNPVVVWVPSIAPSGMAFYTGEAFPSWRGDLFVGALAGQHLRRIELGGVHGDRILGEDILLLDEIGRIRDVRQGPDGLLYLLTDESDGGLYRLSP